MRHQAAKFVLANSRGPAPTRLRVKGAARLTSPFQLKIALRNGIDAVGRGRDDCSPIMSPNEQGRCSMAAKKKAKKKTKKKAAKKKAKRK